MSCCCSHPKIDFEFAGRSVEKRKEPSLCFVAYNKGLIREGYIGKCRYMFFDIWDVISLYRRELETNAFKL